MAEIKLSRIDFRLIHGQIITMWRKVYDVNKIVVIDDVLAADDFMIRVYASAAPAGVNVKVYSIEKAIRLWNKNQFGENNDVLLLFKDVDTCYKSIKAGLPLKSIQIGGVPANPERKSIKKAVFLGEEEMTLIHEMHDTMGVDFTVQVVPEDSRMPYNELLKVYENKK